MRTSWLKFPRRGNRNQKLRKLAGKLKSPRIVPRYEILDRNTFLEATSNVRFHFFSEAIYFSTEAPFNEEMFSLQNRLSYSNSISVICPGFHIHVDVILSQKQFVKCICKSFGIFPAFCSAGRPRQRWLNNVNGLSGEDFLPLLTEKGRIHFRLKPIFQINRLCSERNPSLLFRINT